MALVDMGDEDSMSFRADQVAGNTFLSIYLFLSQIFGWLYRKMNTEKHPSPSLAGRPGTSSSLSLITMWHRARSGPPRSSPSGVLHIMSRYSVTVAQGWARGTIAPPPPKWVDPQKIYKKYVINSY